MTYCSQKKNEEHTLVLLVFRKNPKKWNYGWRSVLKTCAALIVGIFERICCFDEVFLMALTSTELLFIERPYPIFSNLCKKSSLQCYRLYNFLSFRSSHWTCYVRKGVLGNFAKFTGKHMWQSLFFSKAGCWGDCFWSFSCLLLKISRLFHFKRKWNEKRKIPCWSSKSTFFARVLIYSMLGFQKKFGSW